jgi:hypothetical protein
MVLVVNLPPLVSGVKFSSPADYAAATSNQPGARSIKNDEAKAAL